MNAYLVQQFGINRRQVLANYARQDAKRTMIADRASMTGVTSDDQMVEFSSNMNKWLNVDSGYPVVIQKITWVEIE